MTTILKVSVHNPGENPVFGGLSTHISVDDQAAGGYLVLETHGDGIEPGKISIEKDELDEIYKEAKKLIAQYEKNAQSSR